MSSLETASRRLAVAVAALLIVALLAPASARSAPQYTSGMAVTAAADSAQLLRTEPSYEAAVAGEVAPGAWMTVVSGPYTDTAGNAWYEVDAGGYLPEWAFAAAAPADTGSAALAQEIPIDAAYDPVTAAPVYEEVPAEATWQEAPADGTWQEAPADQGWQDPAAAPAAEAAPADAVYTEAAPEAVPAEPVPATAPAPTAPTYDPANVIATAWIVGTNGAGTTCRGGMDWAAAEVGWLAEGQAVDVIGETAGEWQPVNCGGLAAFVHASFIGWQPPATVDASGGDGEWVASAPAAEPAATETEALQNRKRDRGDDGGDRGDEPPAGGSGQAIADYAMQFEGYPYVFGAAGPDAFDCSGFTMYVFQQALGLDISRDLFAQYEGGRKVGRDELQPGDLVFFQNTYKPGLSHNGIYIGGGKMIHAENESTGVKISDINAEYYASRWYGAVRYT